MKTNKDFRIEFFGRNPFNKESRKELIEKWSKMTDAEKLDFMNERMKHFENKDDHFSIESIDKRCEKWMSMTTEEKQVFVDERKKQFEERAGHFGQFFHHMR